MKQKVCLGGVGEASMSGMFSNKLKEVNVANHTCVLTSHWEMIVPVK